MRGELWEPRPEERERVHSREVELRKVEKELATKSRECEELAQRVTRDRQALEARSPLARLRRVERAALQSALPSSARRLAGEQEKVRELEARRERLQKDAADQGAWQQRQKLATDRAKAVGAELSARRPGRLAELTWAPPAHVIEALGERPDGLWERASWKLAASALEAYVERYESAEVGLTDISHSAQTRDLRAVAAQVAAVRKRSRAEDEESAVGRKPSVGERVGPIVSIEERRAQQARQAAKAADKEPVRHKPYSQDHHYGQHHHHGIGQKPPSIAMGP